MDETYRMLCNQFVADRDLGVARIAADYLEEHGDGKRAAKVREAAASSNDEPNKWDICRILDLLVIPELAGWDDPFAFAGEGFGCNAGTPEKALPNDDVSVAPFGRLDVKRIIAMKEEHGDYAETDCLIVGELHDGRFFALDACCDTTGWD